MHKISTFVDYNQKLKNSDTKFNEPTNKNSLEVPEVFNLKSKKTLF